MSTDARALRIASTARRSSASLLPRPCSGAAASAPASVTRRSSRARLRLIFGSSIIERSGYTDVRSGTAVIVTLTQSSLVSKGPDGLLEELTPELPHPADWVRHCLEGYDRGPLRCLDDGDRIGFRKALGVDADHAQVHSAFLHHEGAHPGVPFEAAGARDLQPGDRSDLAAHEPGDRHPSAADVRLNMSLRADPQIAFTLDLAAEVAQDLTAVLDEELPRKDIIT